MSQLNLKANYKTRLNIVNWAITKTIVTRQLGRPRSPANRFRN